MGEAEILGVIKELNKIEVNGEDNLDTLLTVIRFLKIRANELKKKRIELEKAVNEAVTEVQSGGDADG